ncbi:MAG: glycosyltransferase family 2 protein [Labilithrix sp.]|nr:glycosyltransferase family 2 protein [Labilithrix sp.]MBX3213880.1 glycosyltransferase family 2 protein [Labilithrix sp.]
MSDASNARRRERLNGPLFVVMSFGLLYVSWAGARGAEHASVALPIFFDTPYLAVRTVVSFVFLAFFLVLMARQVLLMIFSVLDQLVRARAERRRRSARGPTFEPLVTIIAPAFNEGKVIEGSIRSLLSLDYPRYEVLVVDDGSTDDTLERARALEGEYPNARVEVLWKPNGGKAAALNFAIERAAGEFVLCMDSDSTLARSSLSEAIRHFEDPDVGAVAGAVEVVNRHSLWSKLQFLEYVKGLNLVRRAQGFVHGVSIVPGPLGLFRKSALTDIGSYSHDTFAEDCDLTLRLLMDGWKICYEPRAVARTEAPEELISLIKQRYRWTRGILQALKKHRRALLGGTPAIVPKIMLWYMVFEALLWPVMTSIVVAFLLAAGLDSAIRPAALYFWVMLVVLDTATTLYCLAIDGKNVLYAFLAPVERMMFTIVLDVCRGLASVEEVFGVEMSWGKLERKGRV